MTKPNPDRLLALRNPELFATIPSPMPLGSDPGLADVTPDTLGDRDVVARVRAEIQAKNAAPPKGELATLEGASLAMFEFGHPAVGRALDKCQAKVAELLAAATDFSEYRAADHSDKSIMEQEAMWVRLESAVKAMNTQGSAP